MKHFLSCLAITAAAVLVTTITLPGSRNSLLAENPVPTSKEIAVTAPALPTISPYNKPTNTEPSDIKPVVNSEETGMVKTEPASVSPCSGESHAGAVPVNSATKGKTSSSANDDAVFARRNPVVQAVNKTKNAIVTIRVPRPNGAKDTIGTGAIIDQHGFIITNKHVIGDAKSVIAVLADETKINADVVVGDPRYDLAILRIRTAKQLTALPLAPVDDLMVGETVIAIGHPFGYNYSVSTGIISALNRDITMPTGDTLTGLIQTNASINPGNSGGPLFNINGEFIGVNVALREGAQNIAFAINVGTVKNFLRQHLSAARVSGVQHGLQCSERTLAETGERQRVLVSWFQGTGDLCKGDELVSIAGKQVTNIFDVERAFWGKKPGDNVQLKIIRQNQAMSVSLTLVASTGAGQTSASLPRAVSQPVGPVAAIADQR